MKNCFDLPLDCLNQKKPLERAEGSSMEKGEYLAYELFNIPGENYSSANQLSLPYFGTGACKEWLKFRDNLIKVVISANSSRESGKFTIACRLLTGDALAVFENRERQGQDECFVRKRVGRCDASRAPYACCSATEALCPSFCA